VGGRGSRGDHVVRILRGEGASVLEKVRVENTMRRLITKALKKGLRGDYGRNQKLSPLWQIFRWWFIAAGLGAVTSIIWK
jgi:hypothetical protein